MKYSKKPARSDIFHDLTLKLDLYEAELAAHKNRVKELFYQRATELADLLERYETLGLEKKYGRKVFVNSVSFDSAALRSLTEAEYTPEFGEGLARTTAQLAEMITTATEEETQHLLRIENALRKSGFNE